MLRDFLAIAGMGLIGYGCWQIYPPLAEIVVGVILITAVVWSMWPSRHKGRAAK